MASLHWVGGLAGHETHWDHAENWSLSQGGAGGAGVPGAGDAVLVDSSTYECDLTVDTSITSLNVSSGVSFDFNGNDVVSSGAQTYGGILYNTGNGNGVIRITGDADLHFAATCQTGVTTDGETNLPGTNCRIYAMDVDLQGTGELHNVLGGNHIFIRNLTCAYAAKTTTVQGNINHPGPWILVNDGVLTCQNTGTLTIVARIFLRSVTQTDPVVLNGADVSASAGFLYWQNWSAISVNVPAVNIGAGYLHWTAFGTTGQTFEFNGNLTFGTAGMRVDSTATNGCTFNLNNVTVTWSGSYLYAYCNKSQQRAAVHFNGSTMNGTTFQIESGDKGTDLYFETSVWSLSGNLTFRSTCTTTVGTATVLFTGTPTVTTAGNHLPTATWQGSATLNRPAFAPGHTYTFAAGRTYTVSVYSGGDCNGSTGAGNFVTLVSGTPGTAWAFNFPSEPTWDYVSVSDCDARGGSQITCEYPCVDGGGNLNFVWEGAMTHTDVGGALTENTTYTAGTYHVTSGVTLGNFNLVWNCAAGPIVIKVKAGVTTAFTAAGTGDITTANTTAVNMVYITSENDDSVAEVVDGSTAVPAIGDYGRGWSITGSGSVVNVSRVEVRYASSTTGVLAWGNAVNQPTNTVDMSYVRLRYCSLPVGTIAYTSFIGFANNLNKYIGAVNLDHIYIDSTCTMENAANAYGIIFYSANISLTNFGVTPTGTAGGVDGLYLYPRLVGAASTITLTNGHVSGLYATDAIQLFQNEAGQTQTATVSNVTFSNEGAGNGFHAYQNAGTLNATLRDCVAVNVDTAATVAYKRTNAAVTLNNCVDNNCTARASAGVTDNAGITADPVFANLPTVWSRYVVGIKTSCALANGFRATSSSVKGLGSRTVTAAGMDVTKDTFDGSQVAGGDTVTPGAWYEVDWTPAGSFKKKFFKFLGLKGR